MQLKYWDFTFWATQTSVSSQDHSLECWARWFLWVPSDSECSVFLCSLWACSVCWSCFQPGVPRFLQKHCPKCLQIENNPKDSLPFLFLNFLQPWLSMMSLVGWWHRSERDVMIWQSLLWWGTGFSWQNSFSCCTKTEREHSASHLHLELER